jgi:hypothetical protein
VVRLERVSEKPSVKAALKKSEEPGISWVRCFIMKAYALEKMKVRLNERIRSKLKIDGRDVVVPVSERIKRARKEKV